MSKFTFGAPTTTAATTNFGFNTPKPATTGFGATTFGTPATTTNTGGLTFSTPATSTATATGALNFTFGGTPITSAPAQPVGLAAVTSTPAPAPAPTSAPLSLFQPAASSAISAPAGGLTFGTTPAATTSTTSTGLSFGLTSAAPTTSLPLNLATSSLSFGAATSAATSTTSSLFGSSSGLFGAKPLGTAAPTTTIAAAPATVNRGLGGLDVSVGNKGLSQNGSNPATVKENLLPNELMSTIDNFKEYVKSQKTLSSDIAKGSSRPLTRCAEDINSLMELVTTLAGSVQRDRTSADKLMHDTAKALQNAEIAQRTHDTPAGLQYENNAPLYFFLELADNFEQDLMLFRSQIETTEKHIHTMMTPKTLTPQELTTTMSKLHESFVAIAGKLQAVHQNVQSKKEQYLNFRKYVLKDSSNVFEDVKSKDNKSMNKISILPTPVMSFDKSLLASQSLNFSQQPVSLITQNPLVLLGNVTTTSFSINPMMAPPTASLTFNSPVNLTAPLSSTDPSSSFQLQKPPLGNKRGKH